MRWSLGRNAFWLWLKGGLIVYFHVRSCSLSNDAVKSRTCFPKNMYDFLQKHVRVFQKSQSCFYGVDIKQFIYLCHLYTLLYIIITKTEHALPIQEWVILILKGMHMTWDSLPTQVDASKHSCK